MLSLSETAKDGAVIAIVGEYETIPGLTMFSLSALEVLCDYALYKSTFTLSNGAISSDLEWHLT